MELWELHARERIRDTLAQYTWSGDSARLDELALAFCPDGVLEIRGEEPLHGRAAIVARLSGVGAGPAVAAGAPATGVRRIVRHNLANIRFTELTPQRAAVSSYFTVFTEIGLDHYGRYRDAFIAVDGPDGPAGTEWLIAHRFVSTDWTAPNSVMVG